MHNRPILRQSKHERAVVYWTRQVGDDRDDKTLLVGRTISHPIVPSFHRSIWNSIVPFWAHCSILNPLFHLEHHRSIWNTIVPFGTPSFHQSICNPIVPFGTPAFSRSIWNPIFPSFHLDPHCSSVPFGTLSFHLERRRSIVPLGTPSCDNF